MLSRNGPDVSPCGRPVLLWSKRIRWTASTRQKPCQGPAGNLWTARLRDPQRLTCASPARAGSRPTATVSGRSRCCTRPTPSRPAGENGGVRASVHGTSHRAARSRLTSRGAAARRQGSGRRHRPRVRRRAPRRVATCQPRLRGGHPAAPQRDAGGGSRDGHRHPMTRRTGHQQAGRLHALPPRRVAPPLDLPPLWQTCTQARRRHGPRFALRPQRRVSPARRRVRSQRTAAAWAPRTSRARPASCRRPWTSTAPLTVAVRWPELARGASAARWLRVCQARLRPAVPSGLVRPAELVRRRQRWTGLGARERPGREPSPSQGQAAQVGRGPTNAGSARIRSAPSWVTASRVSGHR